MKNLFVLGVRIYSNDIQKAILQILSLTANQKSNLCISATGAHGLVFAQKNLEFKKTLNEFFINLPDGKPGVIIGRLKGARNMKRCYGPDFFKETMIQTANNSKIKHFLCGGNDGVSEKLKEKCGQKFNNHNIVGTYCPPFKSINEYNYQGIAQEINNSGANFVWIGLSTPKQELFAKRLSKFTNVYFISTVGAAFDFHIGAVKQAPKLMQKLALEWLFRLVVEPKRLWRRYFEIVPLFLHYNFMEFLMFVFQKKRYLDHE